MSCSNQQILILQSKFVMWHSEILTLPVPILSTFRKIIENGWSYNLCDSNIVDLSCALFTLSLSILRGARESQKLRRNIQYFSEKWFFDNFWKTPNTKFIGCRFDECKFIRTDLRGETDQKFITSKFVNKNEFKDTQGVSTSCHVIWKVCSRLNQG